MQSAWKLCTSPERDPHADVDPNVQGPGWTLKGCAFGLPVHRDVRDGSDTYLTAMQATDLPRARMAAQHVGWCMQPGLASRHMRCGFGICQGSDAAAAAAAPS